MQNFKENGKTVSGNLIPNYFLQHDLYILIFLNENITMKNEQT